MPLLFTYFTTRFRLDALSASFGKKGGRSTGWSMKNNCRNDLRHCTTLSSLLSGLWLPDGGDNTPKRPGSLQPSAKRSKDHELAALTSLLGAWLTVVPWIRVKALHEPPCGEMP
jgi:hypothetical protein